MPSVSNSLDSDKAQRFVGFDLKSKLFAKVIDRSQKQTKCKAEEATNKL